MHVSTSSSKSILDTLYISFPDSIRDCNIVNFFSCNKLLQILGVLVRQHRHVLVLTRRKLNVLVGAKHTTSFDLADHAVHGAVKHEQNYLAIIDIY